MLKKILPLIKKWAPVVIFVSVFILFICGGAAVYVTAGSWSAGGPVGDSFGAVNALFSGLAFAGVIYAILLQREELRLQRDELKMTREELAKSATAQNESARQQKCLARLNALSSLSSSASEEMSRITASIASSPTSSANASRRTEHTRLASLAKDYEEEIRRILASIAD